MKGNQTFVVIVIMLNAMSFGSIWTRLSLNFSSLSLRKVTEFDSFKREIRDNKTSGKIKGFWFELCSALDVRNPMDVLALN